MISLEEDIQVGNFRNNSLKAIINIMYTNNVVTNHLQTLLKPYNITAQQYNVLRILKGAKPKLLSVGAIKEKVLDKNSDISRMLDRLEKKKLIKRKSKAQDRRRMCVSINKNGLQLLKGLESKIIEFEDGLFPSLNDEQLDILNQSIDIVRAVFKENKE